LVVRQFFSSVWLRTHNFCLRIEELLLKILCKLLCSLAADLPACFDSASRKCFVTHRIVQSVCAFQVMLPSILLSQHCTARCTPHCTLRCRRTVMYPPTVAMSLRTPAPAVSWRAVEICFVQYTEREDCITRSLTL
jgi:hypothetical protein